MLIWRGLSTYFLGTPLTAASSPGAFSCFLIFLSATESTYIPVYDLTSPHCVTFPKTTKFSKTSTVVPSSNDRYPRSSVSSTPKNQLHGAHRGH
ncbi:hypothetical protein IWZ00DRAFT_520419, partial [Phyllosticta capitalensis]